MSNNSRELLSIFNQHCMFKMHKDIFSVLLKNEDVKNFFIEQVSIYDKESASTYDLYQDFHSQKKDITDDFFPSSVSVYDKKFIFNHFLNLTVNSKIEKGFLDKHAGSGPFVNTGTFNFTIENASTNKKQSVVLNFKQLIFNDYISNYKLEIEYVNSDNKSKKATIEIVKENKKVAFIHLDFFLIRPKQKDFTQYFETSNNPIFEDLSLEDFNEVILYGGLSQEKNDLLVLSKDNDNFVNYVSDYKNTIFDMIKKKNLKIENKNN